MGMPQLSSRFQRGVLPWLIACILLFIGTCTAAFSLMGVAAAEKANASKTAQHLTIDPTSGAVTGLLSKATNSEASAEPEGAVEPTTTPDADTHPTDASATTAEAQPAANEVANEVTDAPAHAEVASTEAVSAAPPAAPHDPAASDQLMPNPASAPTLATAPVVKTVAAVPPSNESIVAPPAKEITEEVNGLLLPKIGVNGASPATLYTKKVAVKPDMPKVSIVITDAGFNAQSIATMMKLPHTVTIAISPYAPDAAKTISLLHVAGYETWAMLPSIGAKYPANDPGPLGLIPSLPPEELSRRLQTTMSTTLGSVGFILPVDESLSEHPKAFISTLKSIMKRGLLALSTHPTRTVATLTNKDKQLEPMIKRADLVIDVNATPAEVQSKLEGLKTRLVDQASFIVMIPARPNILMAFGDWLTASGFGTGTQMMPLSAMYPAQPILTEESNANQEKTKADFEKSSGAKPKFKPADAEKIREAIH